MDPSSPAIKAEEVLTHNQPSDCWIVIDNQVWDVTSFLAEHPGGAGVILRYAGRDATSGYAEVHSPSVIREGLSPDACKGSLDTASAANSELWIAANRSDDDHDDESSSSTSKKKNGSEERPPLHEIINLYDFDQVASRYAPKKAYTFYSTASTDCWTRDTNEALLKRVWFRPRVMRDVANIDLSSSVLEGKIPMKMPLFICPTGLARLIHPDSELNLARAAEAEGIVQIISSGASAPMQDIVSQAPNHPFFFQLYLNKDRAKSRAVLQKAEALGNIRAIHLTVDAAGRGKRESDERLKTNEVVVNPVTGEKISGPDGMGSGLTRLMGSYIDQGMTWDDIAWIRSVTKLPLVLKGIQTAEDATRAVECGVDAIFLSNHGGRNLDFAPPSILLLLEMHRRCPEVFRKVEVYVDGGFRRGGDIIKALCLGAKAVGIGRTFLYSIFYGTEGAKHLVKILREEMESTMKLIGARDLSQLHPGLVNTSDIDHLVPQQAGHPYATWPPGPKL